MKKLKLILFSLFISFSGFTQVVDYIAAGNYAVTTRANKDSIMYFSAGAKITSKTGTIQGDRVFYVKKQSSLDTINSFGLNANDLVLFERNGIWYGTLTVPANNISYGSWGTGNYPIISGFSTITAWTDEGGGIYSKLVTVDSQPEIVTVNNVQQAQGRTPNSNRYAPAYSSYYHIDSHTGTTSVTDTETNSAVTNWTGATAVIRTDNDMNWAPCAITNHSGSTLTITNSLTLGDGMGYFIQNDIRTLDQFGEWYYGSGKLYMYFGAATPGDYTVKVSSKNTLIDVNTRDYITVKNIKFEGANQNAIETNYASGASNLTVANCTFNFNNRGIYGHISPEMTVKYSTFVNSAYMAIYNHYWSEGAHIHHNTIDSTGLVLGSGSGDGTFIQGIAIYSAYGRHHYSAKNTIIENNTVLNSGYMGVFFGSDNAIVRNNYINKYNLNKSDGGAIYTGIPDSIWVNMVIDKNICLNGTENTDALGQPQNIVVNASYNIYIDNTTDGGVTISNNTTAHTKGAGIMVHMSKNVTIQNNTVYDCTTGVKFQELAGYSTPDITGLSMTGNIIVSKTSPQKVLSARSLTNDFNGFGTINNNYYAKPADGSPNFITMIDPSWAETLRDSSSWRTYSTHDANSIFSKIQVQIDDSIRFYTNPTAAAVTYALNDTLIDAAGTKYNTSVTIPAYSSKILWNDDQPAYTPILTGVQTIGGSAYNGTIRQAMPVTFSQSGTVTAIVIYHGGQLTNNARLKVGLYTDSGALPASKLAESNNTEAITYPGWQRINLVTPVSVTAGPTYWLAWVFEKTPQTYYTAGTPGRANTTGTSFSEGMPASFGTSTTASSRYSIYAISKQSIWLMILLLPNFLIQIFGNRSRRNNRK